MPLFKNGVGRPSNETLKKRKIAYAAMAIGAIALLGTGGYLAYNFTRGDMTTSTKNITTKSLVYGDANGDEKVEIGDATDIQMFLAGNGSVQSTYPKAADVDGDGKISENDATLIQRYVNKQISSLPVKYGDLNNDGKIDQNDITLIQNYLVQKGSLTQEQKLLADVDLNNKVNMDDVTKIQSYIAKQVSSLPILESGMVSKDIPASTTSKKAPTVKISAYKLGSDKKKTGKVLKTTTNANLEFTNWVNYQYMMVIDAKASSGTIKSIKWEITDSQKPTYKEANTTQSWKDGGANTYTYNKASVTKELGIYADGVRLGKVTVTDSNGNSRTIKVRFNIDRTAPKLTFKIAGTKSGSGYLSGAKVTATCTDKLNGVTYMKTYDTQDTSDVVTYNGKATTTKTQSISLVSTGNSRSITTTCKDALGNSTGTKKSSSYKIGYSGTSSSTTTTSNVISATPKVTCPSGYKASGSTCRKGTGAYSYTCPSGYTKQGDGPTANCLKVTSAKATTKDNCTGAYSRSGNYCVSTKNANPNCPSGTTYTGLYCQKSWKATTKAGMLYCGGSAIRAGNTCYLDINPKYSCPSGYTRSGSKCTRKYTAKFTTTYSCSSGTRSGTKCYIYATTSKTQSYVYKNPTKVTYSCPSGYSLNGTQCYKK